MFITDMTSLSHIHIHISYPISTYMCVYLSYHSMLEKLERTDREREKKKEIIYDKKKMNFIEYFFYTLFLITKNGCSIIRLKAQPIYQLSSLHIFVDY